MAEPYIDPNYVNGTQSINYCPFHKLPYRVDTRIYPNGETHCPKGNHPLIGYLDILRGVEVEPPELRDVLEDVPFLLP